MNALIISTFANKSVISKAKLYFACLVAFILSIGSAKTQVAKDSELFLTMKKQDSIFFERGFNLCDILYLDTAVHKNLIFYHDKSGIQNRSQFFDNTRKYLCGGGPQKPIRKVDAESLEVFPMYNDNVLYAALQKGSHRFYLREAGKTDVLTSTAKFIHLYVIENGKWLLREVLSYDHQEPK